MGLQGVGKLNHVFEILRNEKLARLEAEAQALKEQIAKLATGPVEERLLTSKEIAPYLGLSHHKTVEKWVREKGLPCVRIGRNLRFRLGDVLRWRAQRMGG